jgi:raffinose/stachyose/melibiose transport system permease protein
MKKLINGTYTYWFLVPAGVIYLTFFIAPTFMSFFFSLTRWTLFEWEFIGLENFRMFFEESSLRIGFRNTFFFATVTALTKVVIGFALGLILTGGIRYSGYLRSIVFFPTILSIVAVGITFRRLMHPVNGVINRGLAVAGIAGPDWLGNVDIAMLSVSLVDVWRGVGIATVIYIAGMQAIPRDYYEAVAIDGGGFWRQVRHITVPLARPATNSVLLLAMIGGLRTFDLVWTMTGGGPGFATDLIASIIYKQYQAGFFGLATAGNVLLFFLVAVVAIPLYWILNRKEISL